MKNENKRNIKALLVEDNAGDARLIKEMLQESKSPSFELIRSERLDEGLDLLIDNYIDVVLLDLSLPDSKGLETLFRMHFQVPEVPIIVLTGLDDQQVGLKATYNGAQDYLVKGKFDNKSLIHSICYAIERQKYKIETEESKQLDNYKRELQSLRALTIPSISSSPQLKTLGLFKTLPDKFNKLVISFGEILELALIERTYKKPNRHIAKKLSLIAEELGRLQATPKDIIDIYRATLQRINETESKIKGEAYAEEGRLVVLELMGHLLTYYRTCFLYYSNLSQDMQEQDTFEEKPDQGNKYNKHVKDAVVTSTA